MAAYLRANTAMADGRKPFSRALAVSKQSQGRIASAPLHWLSLLLPLDTEHKQRAILGLAQLNANFAVKLFTLAVDVTETFPENRSN